MSDCTEEAFQKGLHRLSDAEFSQTDVDVSFQLKLTHIYLSIRHSQRQSSLLEMVKQLDALPQPFLM